MGKNVFLNVDGNWTNTANWSLGAAPVTGDDVYILNGTQDIVTNLSQTAVILASLNIGMGFTGTIGTVSGNTHTPLAIQTAIANFGIPRQDGIAGAGSQRMIFDFGSATATAVNGFGTANGSLDTGFAPVRWKGTNAGSTANILSGRYGVGTVVGDVATVVTAFVNGGALIYGATVTYTTVNVSGSGSFASYSIGTTLSVTTGGTAIVYGTGKFTTVTTSGNVTLFNRDGSAVIATTAEVLGGGTLDLSGNDIAGSIGTSKLHKGGTIKVNAAAPNNITLGLSMVDSGVLQAA